MDKKLFTTIVYKLCETYDLAASINLRNSVVSIDPNSLPIVSGLQTYFEAILPLDQFEELLIYIDKEYLPDTDVTTAEELYDHLFGEEDN